MSKILQVVDMVRDRLIADGYDGLVQPGECACLRDDLAPCGEIHEDCEAGYRSECNEDCSHEGAGEPDSWHITPGKRK